MLFRTFIIIVLIAIFIAKAFGQDQLPYGRFESENVKVGEPTKYILTYRHKPELEVYFPDSTYDFSPFEFVGKEFFPTITDSLGSFDSVVYTLATYEIDKTQYLNVPVYLPGKEKPVKIFPGEDSIFLAEIIEVMPDSVKALTNTNLVAVDKQFNYPDFLMWSGVVLIVLLILYMIFGEKIKRYLKIRKLQKRNTKFILAFDKLIYGGSTNSQVVEEALVTWKNYTGKLMEIPLASYTTKDITKIVTEKRLTNSLKTIDRAIYAGISDDKMVDHLVYLKDYAAFRYNDRIKEMKGANDESQIAASMKAEWESKNPQTQVENNSQINGQSEETTPVIKKDHILINENILTHSMRFGVLGFLILQFVALPTYIFDIDLDDSIILGCMAGVSLVLPFFASATWLKHFKYYHKFRTIRAITFRNIFFTSLFFLVEFFILLPLLKGNFNSAMLVVSLWASAVVAATATFMSTLITYIFLKGRYNENKVQKKKRYM